MKVNRDMSKTGRKRFISLPLSIVISAVLHIIILFSSSVDSTESRQILLESRKADITFINYSEKMDRWDMVEPVRERPRIDGDFPMLYNKKKKIVNTSKSEPVAESLSAEAVKRRESYEREVLKRIHRMKYYPQFARRMGMEGDVTIRFTLDRSGKIVDHPFIVKGNSHDVLNRAGVLTVTQAAPFPPFPEGAALRDVMTFVVTIDYNLRVN